MTIETLMAIIIAALLAGALAYVELTSRLRTRLTSRAAQWLAARFGLEVVGAVAAVLILPFTGDGWWTEGVPAGLIAGVSVPALLRLRLVTLKVGEAELPVGFATAYEPLRNFIERQIDDIGAAEQSRWINRVVLPRLSQLGTAPEELAYSVRTYIAGLTRLSESTQVATSKFIDTTLADNVSDENKLRLLVQKVADLGGQRLLEDLVAEQS